MNDESPARMSQPSDGHGGLRLLALAAVAAGVLLLAAAAFVLSYAGIHAVALSAGVSARLARIYPLIFDAMLVVACAAVLSLRGAGLPSRSYAWLSLLALLAAAAAADALHATGTRLPRRPAAAAVAVVPWVLVLIGFGLLLCMLRQARLRRSAAAAAQQNVAAEPSGHVALRRGIESRPGPGAPPGESAGRPGEVLRGTAPDLASDLAIDAEPGQDDPASDEAGSALAGEPETARVPHARAEQPAGPDGRLGDHAARTFSPAPTPALAIDSRTERATPGPAASADSGLAGDDADSSGLEPGPEAEAAPEAETAPGAEPMPAAERVPAASQFDRMRSSPVPPEA
jgi:hypothetical protein